jgi:hypothetical protein
MPGLRPAVDDLSGAKPTGAGKRGDQLRVIERNAGTVDINR